jgi:hypothetical protein
MLFLELEAGVMVQCCNVQVGFRAFVYGWWCAARNTHNIDEKCTGILVGVHEGKRTCWKTYA